MANMITTEVAAFNGSVAGAALTSQGNKNCTVTRAGLGQYNVTLSAIAATDINEIVVLPMVGNATALLCVVNITGDTAFQLLFFTDAGAAADPARIAFTVHRMPNAI